MKSLKKVRLIYFLILLTINISYGQNNQENISIDQIEEEYKKLISKEHEMSSDSFKLRIEKLLNSINHENNDKKTDSIKGKLFIELSYFHARKGDYDSVRYFFKEISKNITDTHTLADANELMSKVAYNEANYEAYLPYISNAIHFAKKSNNSRLNQFISLNLCRFYRLSNTKHLAYEILEELYQSIDETSKIDIKYKIACEDFALKYEEKKYDEALSILKKFEKTEISSNRVFSTRYYLNLSETYSFLKKKDSALFYLDKVSNTESAPFLMYATSIYYNVEDYGTALKYFNKVLDYHKNKQDGPKIPISHYDLGYKIHKSLGNTRLAFDFLEKSQTGKDQKNKELTERQYAIFNFELKKNKEINRLETEKKVQEALILENKRRYRYQLVVGLLAVIIVFIVLLSTYKKRQEKKRLILEKNSEINNLKTQYIENITHEFKTPVSVNLGYLDLIKTNILKPTEITNYIDISTDINRKLLTTLEDLLTFIKLDHTDTLVTGHLKEENLFNFLHTEIQKFDYSCATQNVIINLVTNVNPKYTFKFNYSKLTKILDNLLTNAIKFSKNGQTIHVTFLLYADAIMIEVKDEGIGIDKKFHEEIFNRFYQTKQNENNGFGIGLFLVKNIVDTLNGTIKVASALNKGATFTVTIPITTIALEEATSEIFETNYFEKEISEFGNTDVIKILIVENQLEMINYLSHIFAVDYYCDFAYNGEEAYKLIQKNNYELIISDYKMPVMDGLELQSILKENPKTATIPFILISASDIEQQLDGLHNDDLFRFLKKPFSEIELKSLITMFIGEKNNLKKVTTTHETATILKHDTISTFLQKVNTYILENLENDKLKVGDIAQYIGYSQKQFANILHEHTNLNPNKVVLEIRLLKAYEFIVNGNYKTIGEIMAAIGMNSRPYFYKVFEERFGIKVGEMHKKYTKSYHNKDNHS